MGFSGVFDEEEQVREGEGEQYERAASWRGLFFLPQVGSNTSGWEMFWGRHALDGQPRAAVAT